MALVPEHGVVVHQHDLDVMALEICDEAIRARVCAGEEEQDALGHAGSSNFGGEDGRGPCRTQEFCG